MRIVLRVVLALVSIAILVGSVGSGLTRLPSGLSPGLTHLLAYACLGAIMTLVLRARRRGALLALGLTVLFGACIELLQIMLPTRQFSVVDLGTNVLGAGIGVLAGCLVAVLAGQASRTRCARVYD